MRDGSRKIVRASRERDRRRLAGARRIIRIEPSDARPGLGRTTRRTTCQRRPRANAARGSFAARRSGPPQTMMTGGQDRESRGPEHAGWPKSRSRPVARSIPRPMKRMKKPRPKRPKTIEERPRDCSRRPMIRAERPRRTDHVDGGETPSSGPSGSSGAQSRRSRRSPEHAAPRHPLERRRVKLHVIAPLP
jgi:hypothetical protein